MGKTRDLFKKIRDTKGNFLTKMGTIKDRNGMDLTEAEPTPVFLPGESQGGWSLVGCHLWGCTESDTTEVTQQQQQQQKQKLLRRGGKNTQKNYTKKIFMTWIITMV